MITSTKYEITVVVYAADEYRAAEKFNETLEDMHRGGWYVTGTDDSDDKVTWKIHSKVTYCRPLTPVSRLANLNESLENMGLNKPKQHEQENAA